MEQEIERGRGKKGGGERLHAAVPLGTSTYTINVPLAILREEKCKPHSTSPATDTEVKGSLGVLGTLPRIRMEIRQ